MEPSRWQAARRPDRQGCDRHPARRRNGLVLLLRVRAAESGPKRHFGIANCRSAKGLSSVAHDPSSRCRCSRTIYWLALSSSTARKLARHFKLAALVLDFVEQPHVLDGNHRLVGEGLSYKRK
jgi:hypothetical protein